MTAPVPSPAEPMTALLDQLDEARAAATPGEWHVATGGGIDAGDYDTVIGRGDVDCMSHCYGGTSTLEGDNLAPDAALIVAAVNALPTLTDALRRVLAGCDHLDRMRDVFSSAEARMSYADATKHIRACITAALAAPLAGQHTTDEETDRG